jgi:hypothetical protein
MAQKLNTHHATIDRLPSWEGDRYNKGMLRKFLSSDQYLQAGPERPQLVWSGDGGSVGLGHVYLTDTVVALSRAGRIEKATEEVRRQSGAYVSTCLLRDEFGKTVVDALHDGIREEIASWRPAEPGRLFYSFLMFNDQRRHMFNHFENLDLGRIEFHMPFYDTAFITGVFREPIDAFLRHGFYMDWIRRFPQSLTDVPWQAYPGHVPCHLPLPPDLSYQWTRREGVSERRKNKRYLLSEMATQWRDRPFASHYLSSFKMALVYVLIATGKTGLGYHLNVPRALYSASRFAVL